MKKINLIIFLSIVFLFTACERRINIGCLEADGNVTERTLDFDNFSDITISIPALTTITEGPDHEVIIEASSNIIDRIVSDSRKSGNDLDIEVNGCVRFDEEDVLIRITLPNLEAIKIEGIGEVTGTNTIIADDDLKAEIEGDGDINMDVTVSNVTTAKVEGSGDIRLSGTTTELKCEIEGLGNINTSEVNAEIVEAKIEGAGNIVCDVSSELKIDIDGSGRVSATGTATRQDIKLDGTGDVRNFGLAADDTNIDISGLGDVEVNCINTLSVKISGAGSVCYRGTPTIENLNIDGLGNLQDCN